MLDGFVPSSPPHVVRGLTSKVEKLHRTESYETPGGDHAARVDDASAPADALTIAVVRELTTE